MSSNQFIQGLIDNDLELVRSVDKTDLHNHACLGYPLDVLGEHLGRKIPPPPDTFDTFEAFIDYLKNNLHGYIYTRVGFEFSIEQAAITAANDGVSVLEMSIDAQMTGVYEDIGELCSFLGGIVDRYPSVDFRPEIGVNREWDEATVQAWVPPLIETGCFQSIDLYANPKYGPPENFKEIYTAAGKAGLRRKAHAGEYREPEFIRRSVEALELDEVQHGVRAAESPELMRWLSDHQIMLNICPSSNIHLKRVESMSNHPIRTLHDNGVVVSINSDDIMIFGSTVSDDFMRLYSSGAMKAEELDQIRVNALRSRQKKSGDA